MIYVIANLGVLDDGGQRWRASIAEPHEMKDRCRRAGAYITVVWF